MGVRTQQHTIRERCETTKFERVCVEIGCPEANNRLFSWDSRPNVAELSTQAGFDWLVIEIEHSGLYSAEIEHMFPALNRTEMLPLVLVPSSDPFFIQRTLDIGAMGIVLWPVKTPEEAHHIVSCHPLPSPGSAALGALRPSRYTLPPISSSMYIEALNSKTLRRYSASSLVSSIPCIPSRIHPTRRCR